MTTITLETYKEDQLSAIKELAGQLGVTYRVDNADNSLYTAEFKSMLDQRYDDYLKGNVETVSEEESRERVQTLLASQGK